MNLFDFHVNTIDAEILKDIINDENNKWSFTLASYVYDTYISSPSNNINFRFNGNYLVINYMSKRYGYIQLISNKQFENLKDKLLTQTLGVSRHLSFRGQALGFRALGVR